MYTPEEWEDDINWTSYPDVYDNTYWHQFTSATDIQQPSQICAYNDNVSCYIDGDWTTMYSDWRINWTQNCSGSITTGACYYYFEPEECPTIKFISPPSPNGTICPCCASICIGVNNIDSHPMNITIYGSYNNNSYIILNKYINVTNNTFCFCLSSLYIDENTTFNMQYNTTYNWYVEVTDIITEEQVNSSIFTFHTYPNPSYCPCGPLELVEVIDDNDTISDETWILPIAMMFLIIAPIIFRRIRK